MNNSIEIFIAITKSYPSALDETYLQGKLISGFTFWPA